MSKYKKAKISFENTALDKKRKPIYATRKLSIGLVSCMLGVMLFAPSAHAEELDKVDAGTVEQTSNSQANPTNKNGDQGQNAPIQGEPKKETPNVDEKDSSKEEGQPVGESRATNSDPNAQADVLTDAEIEKIKKDAKNMEANKGYEFTDAMVNALKADLLAIKDDANFADKKAAKIKEAIDKNFPKDDKDSPILRRGWVVYDKKSGNTKLDGAGADVGELYMGEQNGHIGKKDYVFTYSAKDPNGTRTITGFTFENAPKGSTVDGKDPSQAYDNDKDRNLDAWNFSTKDVTSSVDKIIELRANNEAKVGKFEMLVKVTDGNGNTSTIRQPGKVKVYIPAENGKILEVEVFSKDFKPDDAIGIYHEMYSNEKQENAIREKIKNGETAGKVIDKNGYLPKDAIITWKTTPVVDKVTEDGKYIKGTALVTYKKDGVDYTEEVENIKIKVVDTKAPDIRRSTLNTVVDKNNPNYLDGKDFGGYNAFVGDDTIQNGGFDNTGLKFGYRTFDNSGRIQELKFEGQPNGSTVAYEQISRKGVSNDNSKGMNYNSGDPEIKLAFDDPKAGEYDKKGSPLFGNLFIQADNTNKVGKYDIKVTSTDAAGHKTVVTNHINVQTYLPAATQDIELKVGDNTKNLKAEDYIGAYLKKYDTKGKGKKADVQSEINGANKDQKLVSSVGDKQKYYPQGTTYEWVTAPNSEKAGDQIAVAKVKIPTVDGKFIEEFVNIKVKVTAPPTMEDVSEQTVKIEGTATPGSKIEIKNKDGVVLAKDVPVGEDGKWSVDVPVGKNLKGGDTVIATEDKDGKLDAVSKKVEKTKKPKQTSSFGVTDKDSITSRSKKIEGTGTPGSNIKITNNAGKTVGTTIADADGNWKISIPKNTPLPEGENLTIEETFEFNKKTETVQVGKPMNEANADAAKKIDFSNFTPVLSNNPKDPSKEEQNSVIDFIKEKNPELGKKIKSISKSRDKNSKGKLELKYKDETKQVLDKEYSELFKEKEDSKTATIDPIYPGAKVITGKTTPGSVITFYNNIFAAKIREVVVSGVADGQGNFKIAIPDDKTINDIKSFGTTEKDKKTVGSGINNIELIPEKTLVNDPAKTSTEENNQIIKAVENAMKKNVDPLPADRKVSIENGEILIKDKSGNLFGKLKLSDYLVKKVKNPEVTPDQKSGDVKVSLGKDDDMATSMVLKYTPSAEGATDTEIVATKGENGWELPQGTDEKIKINSQTGEVTFEKGTVKEGTKVKAIIKGKDKENVSDEKSGQVPDKSAPGQPQIAQDNNTGDTTITPPSDDDTSEIVVQFKGKDGQNKTVTAKKLDDGTWFVPDESGLKVGKDGKITVPSNVVEGGSEITATAKDKSGNGSKPKTETLRPDAPIVNADKRTGDVSIHTPSINVNKLEITYTPAGDKAQEKTVTITRGTDNKWEIPQDETDLTYEESTGHIIIKKGKAKEGAKVTAIAKMGENTSEKSSAKGEAVVPDKTAPAQPTITEGEKGSVKVAPPTDTDLEQVVVTYTDEDGHEQTVTATKGKNGWEIDSTDAKVDGNGNITVKTKAGTNVTAKAIDKADNVSALKEEITKPQAPVVKADADSGDVTITVPSPKEADTVEITYTPAGDKAQEKTVTLTKGNDGNWKLPDDVTDLTIKNNVVTIAKTKAKDNTEVKAVSKKGQGDSAKSSDQSKDNVPDKTAPDAPTVTAKDGGRVDISDPSLLKDEPTKVTVSYIDPNGEKKTAVIKKEGGQWSSEDPIVYNNNTNTYYLPKDKVKGGSEVSVVAEDAAGNKTDVNNKVTTAPEAPKLEQADDGAVTVTPPAEGATSIELSYKDPSGNDKTVTVKKDGNGWKIDGKNPDGVTVEDGKVKIPADKVQKGSAVIAKASNEKNVSSEPGATTTKPENPTVAEVENSKDITVTPPANADSVEITYTPKDATEPKTVEITKGADGKWKLPEGETGLTIDGNGVVTIAKGKAKEETDVKATAKVNKKVPANVEKDKYGAVTVTPPKDAKTVEITYTPAGADKPKTVEITKGEDGTWKLPDGEKDLEITNKGLVTIQSDKLTPNTPVTAIAKTADELKSEEKTQKVSKTSNSNGSSGNNSGNQGGNSGNDGDNTDNQGENSGNEGNDSGKQGEKPGNNGDNSGNQAGNSSSNGKESASIDKPEYKGEDANSNSQGNNAKTSDKVVVQDLDKLTDSEKTKVVEKVKKDYPDAKKVSVDDKGNAILTYEDGSEKKIDASELITEANNPIRIPKVNNSIKVPKQAANAAVKSSANKSAGKNVKTGITSLTGVAGLLLSSVGGLFVSRKKKNK